MIAAVVLVEPNGPTISSMNFSPRKNGVTVPTGVKVSVSMRGSYPQVRNKAQPRRGWAGSALHEARPAARPGPEVERRLAGLLLAEGRRRVVRRDHRLRGRPDGLAGAGEHGDVERRIVDQQLGAALA